MTRTRTGSVRCFADDRLYPGRHGGRCKNCLAVLCGSEGDNALHVRCEALIEHLVGLVQDEVLNAIELQHALANEVEDTSRAADDDIGKIAEGGELFAVADSAVDKCHSKGGIDGSQHHSDLGGKLAGRGHNESPYSIFSVAGESLDREGRGESQGFTRSCRRLQ